jgi:hypothetical protein
MFTHPHITSGIARYRQQEMAAGARQRHLATELRARRRQARAARHGRPVLRRRLAVAAAQLRATARA